MWAGIDIWALLQAALLYLFYQYPYNYVCIRLRPKRTLKATSSCNIFLRAFFFINFTMLFPYIGYITINERITRACVRVRERERVCVCVCVCMRARWTQNETVTIAIVWRHSMKRKNNAAPGRESKSGSASCKWKYWLFSRDSWCLSDSLTNSILVFQNYHQLRKSRIKIYNTGRTSSIRMFSQTLT
jgi:hypothetical protein